MEATPAEVSPRRGDASTEYGVPSTRAEEQSPGVPSTRVEEGLIRIVRWRRLGAGIGQLKVAFTGPLPYAFRQGAFNSKHDKVTRKFIKDHHLSNVANEDDGKVTDIDKDDK